MATEVVSQEQSKIFSHLQEDIYKWAISNQFKKLLQALLTSKTGQSNHDKY
jgi:hypothetical protein